MTAAAAAVRVTAPSGTVHIIATRAATARGVTAAAITRCGIRLPARRHWPAVVAVFTGDTTATPWPTTTDPATCRSCATNDDEASS